MERYKTHIRMLLVLACSCMSLLASCGSNEMKPAVEQPEPTCLVLYTGVLGQTRATEIPENEKIHTLRIIILRPDGSVEYNRFVADMAVNNLFLQEFWVIPDEPKKIILIANEYDTFGLSAFTSESTSTADIMSHLETISYTYDAAKPIPMTGVYDIPAIVAGNRLEQSLDVVRGVAKFSFEFVNQRITDVVVSSMSVSKLADKSYLLPHFTQEGIWRSAPDGSGVFVWSEYSLNGKIYISWEQWLKALVDGQNNGSERTEKMYSDADGWIMGYELPEGTKSEERTLVDDPFDVPKNSTYQLERCFYYPESKNLKEGVSQIPGLEQSYTLNLTMGDKDLNSFEFTSEFSNLRSLFRNTHVRVTVILPKHIDVPIEVYTAIVPWEEGKGISDPFDVTDPDITK